MKINSMIRLSLFLIVLFSARLSFAAEHVRLAYPSLSSSVFYFIIAQKEGYYKEEGLNVEILSVRGEIAIRTALAGEVDFFTNVGSALVAAVRGVPVKILSVVQDRPSWDLVVQPSIRSIAQLKGATIGVMSPEGSIAVVAREMLRKNGIDPTKDVNLVVMGGDDVRFMALKGGAIQATLMNPATSIAAQKEGFSKLASSGEYVRYLQGGIATSDEEIRQSPGKIQKFLHASLKGLTFFLNKRDASVNYIMDIMKLKDPQLASAIYGYDAKLMSSEGVTQEKLLQELIDDARARAKISREIKVADVFDFAFVRKAHEELKASGWKP